MKYIVQIPEPCHESWHKMTRSEKGKYCAVCEKEVQDFTKLTNYQIAKRLDNNQDICGRFKKEQLNTTLNSNDRTRFSKTKMLVGFTALFAITTPVFSQGKPIKIEQVKEAKPFVSIFKDKNKPKEKLITIKGIVSEDTYEGLEPVHDITVKLKNAQLSTVTDFDGQFKLVLTESQFKNGVLEFSHVSYDKKEVVLKNKNEVVNVIIKMEATVLGGPQFVRKQNFFQRIGNLFKKKNCRK